MKDIFRVPVGAKEGIIYKYVPACFRINMLAYQGAYSQHCLCDGVSKFCTYF